MIRLAMTVMFAHGGGVRRARSKQRLQFGECGGDGAAMVNHSRSVADQFRPARLRRIKAALRQTTRDQPPKESLISSRRCVMESDLPTRHVCRLRSASDAGSRCSSIRRRHGGDSRPGAASSLLSAYATVSYVAVLTALWCSSVLRLRCGRRQMQGRERRRDLRAMAFEPRRQDERLAQVRRILVDGKAGTVGRELEQHPAGFGEVHRLEPESIDHRGRTPACASRSASRTAC